MAVASQNTQLLLGNPLYLAVSQTSIRNHNCCRLDPLQMWYISLQQRNCLFTAAGNTAFYLHPTASLTTELQWYPSSHPPRPRSLANTRCQLMTSRGPETLMSKNSSCSVSRAAQDAGGREGCVYCCLIQSKLWKMLSKKEVDAEWSVGMVSWFTSDRSHLILSQWNTKQTVVHGLTFCQVLQCLQCATAKLDWTFLGIVLRRA